MVASLVGGDGSFIYVDPTSTSTYNDGCGNSTAFACPTIQNAFDQCSSDDIIYLASGTYTGIGNENINAPNGVYNVSILGVHPPEEIVLVCSRTPSRVISTRNGFISRMHNFTISNCAGDIRQSILEDVKGGALVLRNTTISIENMIFSNNTALSGGAILVTRSNVTIRNTKFLGNQGHENGGAVNMDQSSAVHVSDSLFQENLATANVGPQADLGGRGGAFYVNSITDSVTNNISFYFLRTTFISNAASVSGGAVFISHGDSSFKECKFIENSALGPSSCLAEASCDVLGGAVVINNANSTFEMCEFNSNFADGGESSQFTEGGALYASTDTIDRVLHSHSITIKQSNFSSNSARSKENGNSGGVGGAVSIHSCMVIIDDSSFNNNQVGSDQLFYDFSSAGGAVSFDGLQPLIIRKSNFSANIAWGGAGAALYGTNILDLDVSDSIFTGNTAYSSYTFKAQGGAIALFRTQAGKVLASVKHSAFVNNTAAPRVGVVPLTLSGSGGAIFMQSANIKFSSITFIGNIAFSGQFDAGSGGGGVFIEDSVLTTFDKCRFIANGAMGFASDSSYTGSGSGGGLYLKFASAKISGSEFSKNWVTAGGTQYSIGGAIVAIYEYTTGSPQPITITSSNFTLNVALPTTCGESSLPRAGQGGAIAAVGVQTEGFVLDGCIFSRNIAEAAATTVIPSYGGSICAVQGSKIHGNNLKFEDNLALGGLGNDIATPSEGGPTEVILDFVQSFFKTFHSPSFHLNDTNGIEEFICSLPIPYSSSDSKLVPIYADVSLERNRRGLKVSEMDSALLKFQEMNGDNSTYDSIDLFRRRLAVEERNSYLSSLSMVVNGGQLKIHSSAFVGDYHVFSGDLLGILSGKEFVDLNTGNMVISLLNNDNSDLMVTSYSGNVSIISTRNSECSLQSFSLINSSLETSSNITVIGDKYPSVLVGAILRRNNIYKTRPTLSFGGVLLTGLKYLLSAFPGAKLNRVSPDVPKLVIDGMIIKVDGAYVVASSEYGQGNSSFRPAVYFEMCNNGSLVVSQGGKLTLTSSIRLVGTGMLLSNAGLISLAMSDSGPYTSQLIVEGDYDQQNTGVLNVTLDENSKTSPFLFSRTNASILGSLYLNLEPGTTLELYPPDSPSSWVAAEFDVTSLNAGGTWKTISPPGVAFEVVTKVNSDPNDGEKIESSLKKNKDRVFGVTNTLVSSNIACNAVTKYYEGIANVPDPTLYTCYICLLNSTCAYCGSGCFDQGSNDCVGSTKTKNCCPEECHNRGDCISSDDYTKFECDCVFFYGGSSCGSLSIYSYTIIGGGLFFFFFSLLSLRYYFFYRTQKVRVLEKLRYRLLNEGDGDDEMMVDDQNAYLESLQQALILKDVFVKYSEIKIEEQVGQGSFGVVYKATYRGAQVALKKMKAPMFMEMTQDDVENFRKEAYMMSRLRHPNIVLVMGVALVDQSEVLKKEKSLSSFGQSFTSKKERFISEDTEDGPSPNGKIVCILTEYLDQGSLADLLYGPNRVSSDIWSYGTVLTCAIQAAKGMLYLHSQSPPICHRDLKSSNLVVDDHWVVKVTDFGMSRIIPDDDRRDDSQRRKESVTSSITGSFDLTQGGSFTEKPHDDKSETSDPFMHSSFLRASFSGNAVGRADLPEMTSNLGTTAWCAPEVFTNTAKAQYSLKVDVYSFGIVLWELWERQKPFEEMASRFDIVDAIKAGNRPAISITCPPALKALMQRCWHTDPERRPKFKYIVRYLKDELAKVKRQAPPTNRRDNFSWLPGLGLLNSSVDNPTFSPGVLRSTSPDYPRPFGLSSGPAISVDAADTDFVTSPMFEPTSATPYVPMPAPKVLQRGPGKSWRDQYVLKASGWSPSQPDVGLPPTAHSTSTQEKNSTDKGKL